MHDSQKPTTSDASATNDPVLVATLAEAMVLLVKEMMVKDGFFIAAEEDDLEAFLALLSQMQAATERFLGVTNDLI